MPSGFSGASALSFALCSRSATSRRQTMCWLMLPPTTTQLVSIPLFFPGALHSRLSPPGMFSLPSSPIVGGPSFPLTPDMLAVQSAIWSSIWSKETTQSYLSRKAKWITFCNAYRRASADFSPRNLIDYVTYLVTIANSGAPHAWRTVVAYLGFVGQLAQFATGTTQNPVSHPHVAAFMKGVGRWLGKAIKKAEPCTLQHLRALSLAAAADPANSALATVVLIAILAFWGCLRLGTFLPKSSPARAFRLNDLKAHPRGLTLQIRNGKTIQFDERVKFLDLPSRPDKLVCPVEAWTRWKRMHALPALSSPTSSTMQSPILAANLSRSTFLRLIVDIPTLYGLPPLSGHSFRRGFVYLALSTGVPMDRLMLHGDWHSLEVALSYAEDLLIPNPL